MTLPPFPAHLAKPMKMAALDSTHRLDSAAKSMLLAYYTADHEHGGSRFHFDEGLRKLHEAAAALGYTLTPVVQSPEVVRTAEALLDDEVFFEFRADPPGPRNLAPIVHDGTGVYFDGGL